MLTQLDAPKQPRPAPLMWPAIALLAHDRMQRELLSLANEYASVLGQITLIATRDIGHLLVREAKLHVVMVGDGSFGGDLEIAALAVTGALAAVVFLLDPMGSRNDAGAATPPPDAVLRACAIHNVPLATNPATARAVLARLEARVPNLTPVPQGA